MTPAILEVVHTISLRGPRGRLLLAGITALVLSSCLDVVQTIELGGQSMDTTIRLTISKGTFEAVAAAGGEEPDFSDVPDFAGEDSPVDFDVPGITVTTRAINSPTEIGVEWSASYPPRALDGAEIDGRYFLPGRSADGIELYLPPSEEPPEDQLTAAFLGGAKYRLLLTGGRPISEVSVDGNTELDTTTLIGNVTYIELPLTVWLTATEPVRIQILF